MAISKEMAADFQSLIATLTPDQFHQMLVRTMQANNLSSIQVQKEVVKVPADNNGVAFEVCYVMKFNRPEDSEYFLQPDEKIT